MAEHPFAGEHADRLGAASTAAAISALRAMKCTPPRPGFRDYLTINKATG